MKVVHLDKINVLINDVYKVKNDQLFEWKNDKSMEDAIELIDYFSINKQKFIDDVGVLSSSQLPIFSELVDYELESKKDLVEFSYEEMLELVRKLAKNKMFTSRSKFNSYLSIFHHYTKWGYESELRDDIITVEDITNSIKLQDAVDDEMLKYRTLTRNEMQFYINNCDQDRTSILLMSAIEGLKTSEVLEIKIDEFKVEENHPLTLSTRVVNVSDLLYNKMYKYSKVEVSERPFGKHKVIKEVPLANTGYLIRPIVTSRVKLEKMTPIAAALIVKKDLSILGYDGDSRDFRTSSILNDSIEGMSYVDINEKYGLNYGNDSQIDQYKMKILREKRSDEY